MKQVTIDKKTTRFFVALAKVDMHSFIMVGVYENNTFKHLFCRMGKSAHGEKAKFFCADEVNASHFICQALFSNVKAGLNDEGVFRKKKMSTSISYEAYDITYAHYLEFLHTLSALQTPDNTFFCYQPVSETDDSVILEHGKVSQVSVSKNIDPLKECVAGLNISNTCRHTAIALVENIQQASVSSSVPLFFGNNFACTTVMEYGVPVESIPFYVLPLSPATYPDLDPNKKWIIEKLYRRMEQMLLLQGHAQETQDKLNCLKNLYEELVGPQKDLLLDELLTSIHTWKEKNYTTLATLRQKFVWDFFLKRTAATELMVEEIETEIKSKLA